MINPHNPPAQLINVQRPHQIQPPGGHRIPGQAMPQGQMRMPADPNNLGQPAMMNMQAQRAQQPMQQQQQQSQGMMMNMGQQMRAQPNQQMHQQQPRGNQQQQPQHIRGMPAQGQHPQIQQQMRMQQGQQNIPPQQQQQRMQNIPQNQQMRMQQAQAPNQQQPQQMRMQPPLQHQMQQGPSPQQPQQMQQGPSQQQMRIQQQPQMQQDPQFQMSQSQPIMNRPPSHSQQMQQTPSHINGPPQQQQQIRIMQQDSHIQKGQQMMNGPSPQPQMQQTTNVGPPQQTSMQMQHQVGQNQVIRGQMQNSPQPPIRVPAQQPQQQQSNFTPQQIQSMQQVRQPMQQGRPNSQMVQQQSQQQQQRPIPINRNIQQNVPEIQQMQRPQQQQQQQQQPQQQPRLVQIDHDSKQTIRINGDQALVDGVPFRLLHVPAGVDPTTIDISQLIAQSPDTNQQQQQQQPQKPTLQHRTSSHQMLPPQNQQMIQQMQTPPTAAPIKTPKPRNRGKKNVPEQQPMSNGGVNGHQVIQNLDEQKIPMNEPSGMVKGRARPGPSQMNLLPPNGKPEQRFSTSQPMNMIQQGKPMAPTANVNVPPQRRVPQPNDNKGPPRNQQPVKPLPNGRQQINRPAPMTSQPSTSQQKDTGSDKAEVIRNALAMHLEGKAKMTPEYIAYVRGELQRLVNEMEKMHLTSERRYQGLKKLLAMLSEEDFKPTQLPRRAPLALQKPPSEEELEEPANETPEERKKRYSGYMDTLTKIYPPKSWDVKFARISDDTIRKEAAYYVQQDMKSREAYLRATVHTLPEEDQTTAKIEYLGLSLLELQKKVRKEVEETLVFEPPNEFLINPWSVRRTKAEYNLELKRHPDRAVLEKRRRITNNLLLHNLSKHTRDFKEFHKSLLAKHTKVRKSMQTYITNEAKKKTREELKNEKLRIQKLIQEDEEGYRAMLDDKKDQRLVYLLEQTDDYIENLCELLKKQQGTVDVRISRKEFDGSMKQEKVKNILDKARNDDDEYEKTKTNLEDYYTTAHGVHEEITEQHFMMGGGNPTLKLKPYQLKGLEWMVSLFNNNLNGILADEMGLGKTIQTIAFITYLMEIKKTSGPFLVIVPLSTIPNWKNEFDKWAANVHLIVYKGPKDSRKITEPIIKSGKFNVLLTTFEYVIREKALLGKLRWKYMIIDEGHRLKNQHCKLTEMLNTRFQCQRRLLITGTPLQNKLPELWALLNFLLPTIFSSCSTFEQWFNAPFATTGEKVELTQEETMLIIRRLHKVLRPFLLRRLKKEVESELPDKMEFVMKCEMSSLQKMLYKHMQKGLLLDGKTNTGSRSLMNSMVHLRKLCNHPFLFRNVEESCRVFWDVKYITGTDLYRVSGKLELLDRILPKLQASGHRVLMFFQMTSMMTVVEDYLAIRAMHYLRLDGTTKPDERGLLLDKFNAPNSKYFLFMLSTRAGGLGLNLQTADTVIIFDSDWNPHQDMQAQDRAHRIGQKAEVRVFRLITANSVEEKILASAKFKLNVDEKVIQAGKFDNRSTGAERRQILEQIIKAENEAEEDEELPNDEDINEMLARNDKEFELFQQMDEERFAYDKANGVKPRLVGDDEIPKDILRAADETDTMEKAKEEGLVYLEVMPGSRRKRKEVDYSADSLSDDKFLEKLFDGEDIAPSKSETTEVAPKEIEKPSTSEPQSSITFKVPKLVLKLGDEQKRKHKTSESEESPKKKDKKEEKQRKRSFEGIEKIKIKLPGEPGEKYKKPNENPFGKKEESPKKKKHRQENEEPEKKKKKHKHKKHDELTETPEKQQTESSPQQPIKLKLNVRFKMPDQVFDIPAREAEQKERSEQKKKARENETEEERKARKEAKREQKRLRIEQEEKERLQEKLEKKARKEQKRLEKERLEAAGSAANSSNSSAAGSA